MNKKEEIALNFLKNALNKEKQILKTYKNWLIEFIEKNINNIKIIKNKFLCDSNFYKLFIEYIKTYHTQIYSKKNELKLDNQFYKIFNFLKRKEYIHKNSVYFPKSMILQSINPNPFYILNTDFNDLDIFVNNLNILKQQISNDNKKLINIYIYLRLFHEYPFSKTILETLMIDDIVILNENRCVFILYYKLFVKTNKNDRFYKIIVIDKFLSSVFFNIKSLWNNKEDRRVFPNIDFFEDKLTRYKNSYLKNINLLKIKAINKTYYTFKNNTIYATLTSKIIQSVPLTIIELDKVKPGVVSKELIIKEHEYISKAFKREKNANIADVEYFDMYESILFEKLMKSKIKDIDKKLIEKTIKDIEKKIKNSLYHHKIIYEYINYQLKKLYNNKITISTFKNYIYTLNKHIFRMIEDLNNIKSYEIALILQRFENNSYTKNTIDRINTIFKHFFTFIKIKGFVIDVPSLLYSKSIIFKDEIDVILNYIEQTNNIYNSIRQSYKIKFILLQKKAFLLIAFYTGLRKSELISRLLKDFYLYNNKIYIDINNKGMKSLALKLKTKNSKRRVEAIIENDSHLKIIKEWIQLRQKISKGKYLFLKNNGNKIINKPFDDENIEFYNKIIKKITSRYATFHSLRHSFATYELKKILEKQNNNKAYDILELSIMMGHQTPEVTINKYFHFDLIKII